MNQKPETLRLWNIAIRLFNLYRLPRFVIFFVRQECLTYLSMGRTIIPVCLPITTLPPFPVGQTFLSVSISDETNDCLYYVLEKHGLRFASSPSEFLFID